MLRTYGFVPRSQPHCDGVLVADTSVSLQPTGRPAWDNGTTDGLRAALERALEDYAGPCKQCTPDVRAVYDNARRFVERALTALDRDEL